MKRLLVSLALLAAACSSAPAPTEPGVARVETGALRGAINGDVISFKNVPYAAPPVGDLRWRPPQPAANWGGVRDASAHGPICMQKMPNPDNGIGQYPASEDCLTLAVYTTSLKPSARLPVMVWIHGGGFVNGSGSAELYDGSQLAKRGVVVVSINYRLGRFGSFAHPLLVAEAKGAPVANYGMMDMIAALKWVKQNIDAFGGDASNVTIFGESAGGMAVQKLMVSPEARGTFHKAIVQSGAGRENVLYLDKANSRGLPSAQSADEAFIKSLNVAAASTADLRAIPADRILNAGDPSTFSGGGPIIDGKVIPMTVMEAFEKNLEAKVPYITGYNGAEFPSQPGQIDGSLARLAPMTPDQRAALEKLYPPEDFPAMVVGDIVFAEPARALAALHARNGQPSYLYRFNVISSSVRHRLRGTTHAQERQYVFDTLHASPYATDDNDKVQAQHAVTYWTNFAKTGDPNGAGQPAWPKYSAASDTLLEFANEGPAAKPTPFVERLKMIASRY